MKICLSMYKKYGTTSLITIPMRFGLPLTREAEEFLKNLRQSVKGTNKRVVIKGRKPVLGVKYDRCGNIPIVAAQEADIYIYNKY